MSPALAVPVADQKAQRAAAPVPRPLANAGRESLTGGPARRPSSVAVGAPVARRCACGGNLGATGECAACRAKREGAQRSR